ncbi:TPA: BMC domain-containing protein [Candidatus Poribacteria bacterium]|nr:BMC domain-containing protein [Candidatus Poribacteria bacterium]
MRVELINAPTEGTVRRLCRRMRYLDEREREDIRSRRWGAVALIQGPLAEIFTAADRAEKAANVIVEEIIGNCPQQIIVMAIFGDTSAVQAAVNAIKS